MPRPVRTRPSSRILPLRLAASAPALAAAGCLCLAACAYRPVSQVRYEPDGGEDVWSEGLRLHPARTDSLTVLSGFLDHGARATPEGPLFGTPLTFLILAQNTSGKALTLDPLRFRLHAPAAGLSLAPLDPEAEIRAAARDLADEHGRYTQQQATDAVVDGVGAVLDLLSLFAERLPAEEEESRRQREEIRERREEEAREHGVAMRAASARHSRWTGRSLRKTTLLPGMRVEGTVSFVQNAATPYPDTLLLQYGSEGVPLEPLGRYAKVVDSLPGPARPAPPASDTSDGPLSPYAGPKPAGPLFPARGLLSTSPKSVDPKAASTRP